MAKSLTKASAAVKTSQTRGMTSAAPAKRPAVKPAPAATPAPACAAASLRPAPVQVTQEAIARRAREIWASGKGGSDLQNWLQAEKELRAAR